MVKIVAAVRTPIGKFGGMLSKVSAPELGSIVIRSLLEKSGCNADAIDEVIMGNVLQAGIGQGPARQAAVKAGLPVSIPALTLNNICGSGLKAVNLAVAMIESGQADVVIAGGMENMSAAPYLLPKARWGQGLGNGDLLDSMLCDALTDAFDGYHMGITAERVAERYNISRLEQDEFAVMSQQKAQKAQENLRFSDEITPVKIQNKKSDDVIVQIDEYPRQDVTLESISALSPAFDDKGTVTAANASGINDGAAAVLLMSETKAKELGLNPMAEIVSTASTGVDPSIMGIGPISAIQKCLKQSNLSLKQIDLIELNEAFAAQSLAVCKELGLNRDIVNVNGGAIALGHPVGASGARILVTLIHEMQKRQNTYGLASLCVGGGMGVATLIKM
ncbi:acetyl-CoA C-acetyltransferase [Gammaproteobacteria bacterium AH-315-E17]|nr:acetyl-CoA C-acetyltransferase [Gammaproteobacteria bacterium AH-315-E17]